MPTRQQTTDPEDRPDIRHYAEGGAAGISNIATDLGQYETNLTVGAGSDVVYEGTSTRFNLSHPRTIALELGDCTGSLGVLWRHGETPNIERLEVIAGPTFRWIQASGDIFNTPWPSGDNIIVVVHSQANPATTGASDAVLSWVCIYDEDTGTLERHEVIHAAKASGSWTAYVGAQSSIGTSSYIDGGGLIERFRFSSRFVAFSEIAQDWIASRSAITGRVAELRRQGLPLTEASGIGAQGEYHGPAASVVAAELRHTQWRTMGALANWRFRNVSTVNETSHTNSTQQEKIRFAPGGDVGTGYRMVLGWFGVFPVAPMANAAWVQFHGRFWNVSNSTLRDFGVRVYSMNRRPQIGQIIGGFPPPEIDPFEYTYVETEFTADDVAPGIWRGQSVLPLSIGRSGQAKGMTYLGLAYAIDMSDATTDTLSVQVDAFHAVQIYDTTLGAPGGGGPDGEGG